MLTSHWGRVECLEWIGTAPHGTASDQLEAQVAQSSQLVAHSWQQVKREDSLARKRERTNTPNGVSVLVRCIRILICTSMSVSSGSLDLTARAILILPPYTHTEYEDEYADL